MLGLPDPKARLIVRGHRLRRRLLKSDERLRDDYLRNVAEPKLQIGGGWHRLDGWLNTDLDLVPGVMLMDATARFPFADGTFQFVYTEHMIEHVPYAGGAGMLRECYRVMRKGGTIRVTTPDLAAIVGLSGPRLSDVQRKYLVWFSRTFLPGESTPRAASVINAHFRLWGHQFIYDEDTLANVLYSTGFSSVQRWRLKESDSPALRGLENTRRYTEGLLDFESMALEAKK
jgi:predicted SAM-dependent methyltransferase